MELDARQLIGKIFGKVTERIEQADGVRFVLDVWTEDLAGVKLTDGETIVGVRTVVWPSELKGTAVSGAFQSIEKYWRQSPRAR